MEPMSSTFRFTCLSAVLAASAPLEAIDRLTLSPFSCCDGQFTTAAAQGERVWRIAAGSNYLYFNVPSTFTFQAGLPVYVEVTYLDEGQGTVALQYDSTNGNVLADFYVRLGRFTEAAITTREYARRFPDDRTFPVRIARLLTSRDRFADVVTTLADVAPRREDAHVYMLLGHSLAAQGRRAEGIAYLERARTMQPGHWWPYYALGWAYSGTGDYARAVASFQRAVELRPGLYDVERELQRIRPLATRAAM